MQISFHMGVHMTDEDRLARCLVGNAAALAAEGICVPTPETYRPVLQTALRALRETADAPAPPTPLADRFGCPPDARRMVLSWQDLPSKRGWAIAENRLYPQAPRALQQLQALFPGHDIAGALAIRNPATLMASLVEHANDKAVRRMLDTTTPQDLRWSDTIGRMRSACPDIPLTVWCDEDTPYLWHEVLQAVSGHSDALRLEHTYDWFAQVMTEDGLTRMLAWIEAHPHATDDQRRRIISAFLDKFFDPEKIDVNLDLPGWTEELVEVMTELYDQDIARLRALPGVTVLSP